MDYNPLSLPDGRKVTIYLGGRPIEAVEGESVGASLHASGIKVISRSLKYHRPRGLYCLNGRCGQCTMRIDGVPNVRICTVEAREGLRMNCQNGVPSVEHDILSIMDRFGFLFPAGFQYKKLFRPSFLVPLYQAVIRRLAGYGSPPEANLASPRSRIMELESEVAVIGGGPSGLSAAKASVETGASTILIDDERSLGGHLRFETSKPYTRHPQFNGRPAFAVARGLAAEVQSNPRVRKVSGTTIGLYGKNLAVATGSEIVLVRSRALIVSTGAYERRPLFNNNDLPGIFGYRAAMKLLNLYRVKPGLKAAVYAADNSSAGALIEVLEETGISLEAYITLGGKPPGLPGNAQVFPRSEVRSALGRKSISGVESASLDGSEVNRIQCDFLCLAGFLQPTYEIQCQAGCQMNMRSDLGGYVATHDERMETTIPSVFVAGEAAGIRDEDSYLYQGRLAGFSAAAKAGYVGEDMSEMDRPKGLNEPVLTPELRMEPLPKSFVCFCEDTTLREIAASIEYGFDDAESLKRYTGTSMGICQGKFCLLNMILALEGMRGKSGSKFTTQRPPIMPISLGSLAVERDER